MSSAQQTDNSASVSVIIPIYNREDTVIACLETIVGQTVAPREIILVDDGSTDNTANVISEWIQRNPLPKTDINYLHQENAGKSSALNTGFAAASSEWIAFNDSDDFWLPNKLDTQLALLESNPTTKLCFTDSRFVNDPTLTESNFQIRGFDKSLAGETTLENPFLILAENPNGIFMQSIIVHRDCAQKVFPLDPNLRVGQDIDLIFRLSLQCHFCLSHEKLVDIDRTPERSIGLTKQHDMKSLFRLETKARIFEGWLEIDSKKIAQVSPQIKKHLSTVQRRIASHHYKTGNRTQAKAAMKRAYQNAPNLKNWVRTLFLQLA